MESYEHIRNWPGGTLEKFLMIFFPFEGCQFYLVNIEQITNWVIGIKLLIKATIVLNSVC